MTSSKKKNQMLRLRASYDPMFLSPVILLYVGNCLDEVAHSDDGQLEELEFGCILFCKKPWGQTTCVEKQVLLLLLKYIWWFLWTYSYPKISLDV